MAGRYRTAFASFNDAATLWKASLESAGNEDLEDGYLDASGDLAGLVATHHVQTVSYGGRPDIQFHHTSLDTWTDAGRAGASAYSHYRGLDWMKNRNNANGTADRLVVSLAVSGYAPPPQIILRQAACIPSDYEPYVHPGTGVIEGQAFLRARDGDVKTGAGSWVKCNPATTYSREWFDVQVMQGIQLAQGNPAILAANNRVQCDAEGRFAIDQLPAGHYFLACTITWETVGSDFVGDPKLRRTGGTAYSEVDVEDGKTAKAILTR